MKRVGIFLSVFDVHTNRAPIDGRITYRQHREGLCLDARSPDCSGKNESMTWAFENPRATLVVKQLTGAIARRIVGWSKVGDELKKGERFGMIRFGSRTEVYLPLDATVLVKVGDRVVGGATVIARLALSMNDGNPEDLPAAESDDGRESVLRVRGDAQDRARRAAAGDAIQTRRRRCSTPPSGTSSAPASSICSMAGWRGSAGRTARSAASSIR